MFQHQQIQTPACVLLLKNALRCYVQEWIGCYHYARIASTSEGHYARHCFMPG